MADWLSCLGSHSDDELEPPDHLPPDRGPRALVLHTKLKRRRSQQKQQRQPVVPGKTQCRSQVDHHYVCSRMREGRAKQREVHVVQMGNVAMKDTIDEIRNHSALRLKGLHNGRITRWTQSRKITQQRRPKAKYRAAKDRDADCLMQCLLRIP